MWLFYCWDPSGFGQSIAPIDTDTSLGGQFRDGLLELVCSKEISQKTWVSE